MRNVLRRIYGLVIILRALMPILLLVAVILIAWRILAEIRAAVREPIEKINHNIEEMTDTLEGAAAGFELVGDQIAGASSAVNQVTGLVGFIPVNVNVNLDPVPVPDGFNTKKISVPGCCSFDLPTSLRIKNLELDEVIPIPGLTQVKGFLGSTFGIFADVNHILTNIVDLIAVTQGMGEIVQVGNQAVAEVVEVFQKWGTIVAVILVLAIVLQISAYVEYLYINLGRGWTMLAGK
jgi:hypothetical protein